MTFEQFKLLLPLACHWVQEHERMILRDGVALTPSQVADAKRVGVFHPELVRLLQVASIPLPEHPMLRALAHDARLVTPNKPGLTMRYGIFIRTEHWDDRQLLVQHLVHTSQYERMAGIQSFLGRYMLDCLVGDYPSTMEAEAITKAAQICPLTTLHLAEMEN